MVYASEVGGKKLTFQVSGKLWNRSLVMRDLETGSLWSHILGECMEGELMGKKLELITRNTGDTAFSITQALHTYFNVGDISQVKILGLDNTQYLDKVDGGAEKAQTGAVDIAEEVDRVYLDVPPSLVIEDAALGQGADTDDFGLERLKPAGLVDAGGDVAIEVAVGAFRLAEGPVYIQAEASVAPVVHQGKQALTSLAKASAR